MMISGGSNGSSSSNVGNNGIREAIKTEVSDRMRRIRVQSSHDPWIIITEAWTLADAIHNNIDDHDDDDDDDDNFTVDTARSTHDCYIPTTTTRFFFSSANSSVDLVMVVFWIGIKATVVVGDQDNKATTASE
jgi:hypothetical protein